jgi:DNA-binding winged helix-turn-helix (wHTH) protein
LVDPGTLVHGDRRARLSSRERPLIALLLEQWPTPMQASEVSRLLWPSCSPSEATRRRTIAQLRRRLATVGLALRCRPHAGYTIEVSPWVLEVASRDDVPR